MSRPCATRVDTARFFLSAGNAVPPPGPGARARVSPGGRVGHPVQQPKASARAVRPARRDRIPTRAGCAEPRGSLCRRGRGPGNGLPGRQFRCVPGPEPRPGLPLFGRCPRARRPTVGRPFRAGHRRSLPTPLVGVRSPVRATSGHPGRSCPGLRGTLAWIVWAPRGESTRSSPASTSDRVDSVDVPPRESTPLPGMPRLYGAAIHGSFRVAVRQLGRVLAESGVLGPPTPSRPGSHRTPALAGSDTRCLPRGRGSGDPILGFPGSPVPGGRLRGSVTLGGAL